MLLAIFVHYLFIGSESLKVLKYVRNILSSRLAMSDLGEVKQYPGIFIVYTRQEKSLYFHKLTRLKKYS